MPTNRLWSHAGRLGSGTILRCEPTVYTPGRNWMSENGGDDDQSDDGDACGDDAREPRPVGDVSLSLDTTLELLADRDRRVVLDYLRDADDRTATIDELAAHLVSQTDDLPSADGGDGPPSADRGDDPPNTDCGDGPPSADHVQTMLHHVHVPKLVDTGVVDYDARNEEIRYWGSKRLERWHDRIQKRDD